jgi:hypothetical protein
MEEVSPDELFVHRWLKEAKADFKAYHEKYQSTGSRQDKFDLLLKYMEVAVAQAKKQSLKRGTH